MAACCSAAMPAIQKLSQLDASSNSRSRKLEIGLEKRRENLARRERRERERESESAEGGFAMRDEELYDVLGVTREATDSEIRRAYR